VVGAGIQGEGHTGHLIIGENKDVAFSDIHQIGRQEFSPRKTIGLKRPADAGFHIKQGIVAPLPETYESLSHPLPEEVPNGLQISNLKVASADHLLQPVLLLFQLRLSLFDGCQ